MIDGVVAEASSAVPSRLGAIEIRDLKKSFRLYRARTFKETVTSVLRGDKLIERRPVLKGVTANIAPGERIGVVGKNGAGKSTLFRILSRVMVPDSGTARATGRVAPLIEVTAGFVPDLTGAENLRLSAAMLGLTRKEVTIRFDSIVAFAGIEEFIATPLRYYSSGMQARLGFSVAAHVDADIVLVDEVLAVGDIDFQHRCIAKMDELAARGATIVFVSHDLNAVTATCKRVLWLDDGRVRADGPTADVLRDYVADAGPS